MNLYILYADCMLDTGDLRVSTRGQVSLPAAALRRWGLQNGGEIAYLDLGDAVVLVHGSLEKLRRDLLGSVDEADWTMARAGFGDRELATE